MGIRRRRQPDDRHGLGSVDEIAELVHVRSRALLGIDGYQGDPFRAHTEVRARRPYTADHVERRLERFGATAAAGS